MKIKVRAYSGYRANERPTSFFIMDREVGITEVLDRWYGPELDYFKVRADDGYVYILKYDHGHDDWDLVMMEKC